MLRGISHPGAVTPTTEDIRAPTVYQAVVELPFGKVVG